MHGEGDWEASPELAGTVGRLPGADPVRFWPAKPEVVVEIEGDQLRLEFGWYRHRPRVRLARRDLCGTGWQRTVIGMWPESRRYSRRYPWVHTRGMADTTVKVDSQTRDRFAAVAAARGQSVRAYLAELAIEEENQIALSKATATFREIIARPGLAEAFDDAFPDDAPARPTGRAA